MRHATAIAGLLLGVGCIPPINDDVRPASSPETVSEDTGLSDTGSPCAEPFEVFFDADGDGYGDSALATEACELPPGHVLQGGDCDDLNSTIHPDAEERCDGVDQDCDGAVDQDLIFEDWYRDADEDGFGHPDDVVTACEAPEGRVSVGGDCDDGDPAISPSAEESCNERDDDCNGEIDDGLERVLWYEDGDGDGYGHPELSVLSCSPVEGHIDNGEDCDDTSAAVSPSAEESCNDLDDDCNGEIDDGLERVHWYEDGDGDGYGHPELSVLSCSPVEGRVDNGEDCDDTSAAVSPSAEESCNDLDDDCNGEIDDGLERVHWYEDGDGDGYGHPELSVLSCSPVEGRVDNGEDCDDTDSSIYPEAGEALTKSDSDCNGVVDDLITDEAVARIDGESVSAGFGYAMSGGHDLDSDDTTDLVVGSRAGDEVHIFSGAGLPSADAAWVHLSGAHTGDQFGRALALVQDIDSDGTVDLVVGAPAANPEYSGAAIISVFLGPLDSLADDADPDTTLPPTPGEVGGGTVADVGHLDDGAAHIGVQATTKVTGTLGVLVYRMTDRGGLESVAEVSGSGAGDEFGAAIGASIDVNGDGLDDLVVGAPGAGSADVPPGLVYVFLSPLGVTMTGEDADVRIVGDAPWSEFGSSTGTIADWDGDGIQNLLVGSPGAGGEAGKAQVFNLSGLSDEVVAADVASATYSGADGRLGHAVHAPGDIDGDGNHDIVLGAPAADDVGVLAGAAYIYWGTGESGTHAPDASIEAVAPMAAVGVSLEATAGAGSDTVQSLLIGGYGADPDDGGDAEDETGAIWLFGFSD